MELLQHLITMTDPADEQEVKSAENILVNLLLLAGKSGMADRKTIVAMRLACEDYQLLLRRKGDFAGEPGDYYTNRVKRQRLAMMLRPNC